MKKRILAFFMTLCMLISVVPMNTFAAASDGSTVLAFTSDVHNKSDDSKAADRLDDWLDMVEAKVNGTIDFMGFCGDIGSAYDNGDTFWNDVKKVMDVVDAHGISAAYTPGNHEYQNGSFASTSNSLKNKYTIDAEAKNGSNYRIYCLGTSSSTSDNIDTSQIDKLETYLNGINDNKPIIILTHFPLHTNSNRTTKNADKAIDVLNAASESGKNILFLWGHNHSQSDPNYDKLFKPNSSITYKSGSSKTIKFYYAAAGCMSDTEYASGSGNVKGKGLVVKISNTNSMSFTYYKEDGSTVLNETITLSGNGGNGDNTGNEGNQGGSTGGSTTGTLATQSSTPTAGKKYVIVATTNNTKYALTTTAGEGYYNTGSSSSQHYNYTGFAGREFTTSMTVTEDMLWSFESASNGFYIKNGNSYLNAEYVSNSTGGKDGNLMLNSTKDVWSLTNSNTRLQSANSAKYLTHSNTSSGAAFVNVFSVRSDSNASSLEFFEFTGEAGGSGSGNQGGNTGGDNTGGSTTGTVATQSSTPVSGKKYVIVATTNNTKYALTTEVDNTGYNNTNGTYIYTGFKGKEFTTSMTVTDDMVWSFESANKGFYIKNGSLYLNATYGKENNKTYGKLMLNSTTDVWSLTNSNTRLQSANSEKYLTHSNGSNGFVNTFSVRSDNNASSLEFYEYTGNAGTTPDQPTTCNHTYGSWTTVTAATCTTAGSEKQVCSKCGDTQTRTVDVLGHSYATAWTTDSTNHWHACSRCSEKGSLAAHNFSNNKCTVCQYTKGNTGGDTTEGTLATQSSTPTAGKKYVIVATTNNTKYAMTTAAGESYSNSNGNYNYTGFAGKEFSTNMTVTADMVWEFVASGNGFHIKNGSKYLVGKYVSNGKGSSGHDGSISLETTTDVWTLESNKLKSTEASKNGRNNQAMYLTHSNTSENQFVNVFSVRSSSNASTLAFYEYTGNAGTTPDQPTTCNHTYGNWTTVTAATCTTAGSEKQVCSKCGDTQTRTIEATGHSYVNNVCTVCGHTNGSTGGDITEGTLATQKSTPAAGKKYVIVATTNNTKYALTTTPGEGYYNTGSSSSQHYNYTGFAGREFTTSMNVTSDMVWSFESASGGFYVMNGNSYLNAEYIDNSTGGKDGNLMLDNTKDVWSLTNSNTRLQSANSTKYLTHSNTSSGASFVNVFSVRSDSNASSLEFYEFTGNAGTTPDQPACDHTYGDWTTVTEATCTAAGSEQRTCSKCNNVETRTVAALGHNYATTWSKDDTNHWKACTNAGCTATDSLAAHNFTNDVCTVCQYERNHTHSTTLVAAKEATCTAAGSKAYYTCSGCDKWFEDAAATKEITDKNSVVIAALDHSFTDYKSNNDATCTTDGTKTAKCDRCDVTDKKVDTGSALRHDFGTNWVYDKDYHWRKCSRCEETDAIAVHSFKKDVCEVCGYVAEHVHNLTEVKEVKATCTAAGSKAYYTCSGCDEWFSDPITEEVIKDKASVKVDKLGHSFTEYKSNNDATCTADGTKTAKCDRCDATETVTDTGSKVEHTYNSVWIANDTTHWHECAVCNAVGNVGEHSFTGDECTVCEYMRDHVHVLKEVKAVEATCTTDGNIAYYTCSGCDKWFEDEAATKLITDKEYVVVKALSHKFTEYKSNNDATCTADGTKTAKCDRCIAIDTVADTGSKLPHNYGADGTEAICTVCGHENPVKPEKKDVTVKFNTSSSNVVYTGDVVELSEEVVDVTSGAGDVTFKYYVDKTCETPTYEGKAKEGQASSLAGVYYVKAFVKENDNYKAAESENIHKLTVSPRKPEIIKAVNKKTYIQLTWEKSSEATGYIIYRRPYGTPASEYEAIATITSKNTLSYNDKGIKAGTRYMYSIAAYKDAEDGTEVVGARVSKAAQIVRSKIKGVKNYNGYVKLTWNKVEGADSYEIWRKVNGKDDTYKRIKTIKDSSVTSYKDKSSKVIVNGRRSYYKVVVKYNGSSSTIGESYRIINNYVKRPTISSVKAASKAFTVKWDKNSSATGYEIMYSTSSSFDNAKTVKVTSKSTVSKKISGLKAGKKYYVKVRSYKIYNDTTYPSAWSGYKSVKVK